MSHASSHSIHPTVDGILAAIVVHEHAAADSAIPAPVFSDWRRRLGRDHADDVLLFQQLVLYWSRLRDGGLLVAADQCLELAKIGLDKQAVLRSQRALEKAGLGAGIGHVPAPSMQATDGMKRRKTGAGFQIGKKAKRAPPPSPSAAPVKAAAKSQPKPGPKPASKSNGAPAKRPTGKVRPR